jgi:hypothetical protein
MFSIRESDMRTSLHDPGAQRNDPRLTDQEVLVERVRLARNVLDQALHAAMPRVVHPQIRSAHTALGRALLKLQGEGPEAQGF